MVRPVKDASSGSGLRRAVVMMSTSSFLVPLVGLLTQPVLSQALGPSGRGEMTAAIVPAVLAGSVATLGLPDALTYLTARNPEITRRALGWAGSISVAMGGLSVLATLAILPALSAGNEALGRLMLLAMALSIPMLVVGAARGAAMGLQLWGSVAIESVITTTIRLVVFVGLWITGDLTPLAGVVVTFAAPAVAGVVYLPLLRRPGTAGAPTTRVVRPMLAFGVKTWFGSVAGVLGATIDQILMTPLASVRELGLFSVASTVMDVPIILALAVAGALRGVNSKSNNPSQVATTTRIAGLLGLVGCMGLGITASWWVPMLFGSDFGAAVVPTQLLFIAAVLYIPGPLAAAGLAAAGRPGLRSLGFGISLAVNVTAFVLIVPHYGIIGACYVGIASSLVQTGFMVFAAHRVLGIRVRDFVIPTSGDFVRIGDEIVGVLRRNRAGWAGGRG